MVEERRKEGLGGGEEIQGGMKFISNELQVPVFNKKEEIFDNLCEKDVPTSRAAWYIKVSHFLRGTFLV